MAEKQKCEHGKKAAIGIQSFGYCLAYVFRDHADNILLAIKPGEKQVSGKCYFERFGVDDQ